MAPPTPDRTAALDAYLADCAQRGLELESRTETQAVVVQRSRAARYLRRGSGNRFVVWVDEHGTVETQAIEARRW